MAVNDKDLHPDDARIAAVYRDAAADEPSAAIDAAVLRNARGALAAAAGDREPRTAWWMPWRIPFAFAAMAVLSVSLVFVVVREGGEPLKLEQAPREAPASAPAAAPAQPEAAQPPPAATAEARPAPASPAPQPRADMRRDQAQSSDRKEAFATRELDERARAAREEPPPAAALQKKLEAPRESATLRDVAPAPDAKALGSTASATRGPESEAASNAQAPAPAASMAAPPPPAAPVPERKPAVAAPAAAPEPQARPYAAPAPKPLVAQRRSAASDAVSPTVRSLIAELDQRPASEWRTRIAALRREGRAADADALVAEFKRRFPDEAPPTPEP